MTDTTTTDTDARLKTFCVEQSANTAELCRQIQAITKYPVKYGTIHGWLRSRTGEEKPRKLPQYLHFIVEQWAKNNGFSP